jgi:dTDP-4-dehydrorhamnose reductase
LSRILITGAAGQAGTALGQELTSAGDLVLAARNDLDLSKPQVIASRLSEIRPDLVINAAAYTAVDKAEVEAELAYTVNAAAVAALGSWAAARQVPLIHFSTDYVFDGMAAEPYRENDPTAPLSVYGKSKAEGEKLLLNTGACCLIIRTAWVYSATGKNFLRTIIRLAEEKDELAVVNDQTGTPTSAPEIAKFVRCILSGGLEKLPVLFKKSDHMVHFTASGQTTWHGFADAIVTGMKQRGLRVKASRVQAIPSSEYPTAALRPKYSCLSAERLKQVFDYYPETWAAALDRVLEMMFGSGAAARAVNQQ